MRVMLLTAALLAAFLAVPGASAESCPQYTTWATDDDGSGYPVAAISPNLDLQSISIGFNADCSRLHIAMQVGSGEADPGTLSTSIENTVELIEPEGAAHDYKIGFQWTTRPAAGTALVDPYVKFYEDGQLLVNTNTGPTAEVKSSWNGDDVLTADLDASVFKDITGWTGFKATGGSPTGTGATPAYAPDEITSDEPFSMYLGIGGDPLFVPAPPVVFEQHFEEAATMPVSLAFNGTPVVQHLNWTEPATSGTLVATVAGTGNLTVTATGADGESFNETVTGNATLELDLPACLPREAGDCIVAFRLQTEDFDGTASIDLVATDGQGEAPGPDAAGGSGPQVNGTTPDGNETLDSTPQDQESPGPALPLLAIAVGLVAALRRR